MHGPGDHSRMGWIKNILGRSIALEQRGKQLHVALVDKPKPPWLDQASSLSQLRVELRARLLAHEADAPAQLMRHLVVVHDALGDKGWAGVDALPPKVVARALMEAELLAADEPSPLLSSLVERLRERKLEADRIELRDADLRDWATTDIPEVSEGSHEEYVRMERSWIGTVPSDLAHRDSRL